MHRWQDGFASALGGASLTYLLLRYPGRQDAEAIVADALLCATKLAEASTTLSWIGVETCVAGLLCWDVSRPSNAPSSKPDHEAILVRMSEHSGIKVLEQKGMDEFKHVRL